MPSAVSGHKSAARRAIGRTRPTAAANGSGSALRGFMLVIVPRESVLTTRRNKLARTRV
jgi:hypothetical protein